MALTGARPGPLRGQSPRDGAGPRCPVLRAPRPRGRARQPHASGAAALAELRGPSASRAFPASRVSLSEAPFLTSPPSPHRQHRAARPPDRPQPLTPSPGIPGPRSRLSGAVERPRDPLTPPAGPVRPEGTGAGSTAPPAPSSCRGRCALTRQRRGSSAGRVAQL